MRERNDATNFDEIPIDESATQPACSSSGLEAPEMIRYLVHLQLRNPDNLRYILSVLRSQLWASLMQDNFHNTCWGEWQGQLTLLLMHMWGESVQLLS